MTVTAPVLATPLPPAPNTNDPDNFDDLADARIEAEGSFGDQLNAMALNMYGNAVEAQARALSAQQSAADAASAASAAAASTTAVKWVAGTYADGAVVWSPTSRFSYRHIGAGASAVDPALDPGSWVLQLFALGLGGMVITGSVDLVVTSGGAISVTPATPGLYITLPDATTLTQGAIAFHAYNAGVYDIGVKNKAGTVLGWIRPGTSGVIGLASSAALAGAWVASGMHKLGTTAQLNVPSIATDKGNFERVAIDANRTLFLFGELYAVVYDASTLTWGAPVLVRAFSAAPFSMVRGVLAGANQVLMLSVSSTGSIEVRVLSVSGTTINPNAAVTGSTSNAITGTGNLVAVGTGYVFSYVTLNTAQACIRAISLSGTAPTIGVEVIFGTSGIAPRLYVSGSVLRVVGYDSSSTVSARAYTLAGVTLTGGTTVVGAPAAQIAERTFVTFVNGNGNIMALYRQDSLLAVAVFKLTGTAEALSYATLGIGIPHDPTYVEVSAGKVAIVATTGINVPVGGVTWNMAIDSGGTVTSGTYGSTGALDGVSAQGAGGLYAIGITAYFCVNTSVGRVYQLALDCSGSSAVLGSCAVAENICAVTPAESDGTRAFNKLTAGASVYGISGGVSLSTGPAATARPYVGAFRASGIQPIPSSGDKFIAGRPGAANEAWGLVNLYVLGTTIKRIEAAA